MSEELKHTKVTKYSDLKDGSIIAITDSYFEELASTKEEVIKSIKTNHRDFMTDYISCLDVITKQQSKELNVRITLDAWNQPNLIIKRYIVKKEDYKRR